MPRDIRVQNANSIIERGIIATFSFLIDHRFCISVAESDLVNAQPGIPQNWRTSVGLLNVLGEGRRNQRCHILYKKKEPKLYIEILFLISNSRCNHNIDGRLMKVNELVYEGKYFILYIYIFFSTLILIRHFLWYSFKETWMA